MLDIPYRKDPAFDLQKYAERSFGVFQEEPYEVTFRFSAAVADAVREHQPPMIQGRRIKLRYAHSGGHNPPIIVIHGNQTQDVPGHYVKYLEKTFRRVLDLHGTPVRIEFRTSDNPYAERKKKMTQREFIQLRRKQEREGKKQP